MGCLNSREDVLLGSRETAPLFDNQLWSINRLAEYLDVPIATIRDWCHKRTVPFVKVGRHIRFKSSDIETWLKQRSVRCR